MRFLAVACCLALAHGCERRPQAEADDYLVRTLSGHTNAVSCVAFSPDGLHLVSGSKDGSIALWRLSDWSRVWTVSLHEDLLGLAVSPDGQYLVSSTGYLRVHRMSDGHVVRSNFQGLRVVLSAALSPNGQYIVTAGEIFESKAKEIRVWSLADPSQSRTLIEYSGEDIYSLVVSPGGECVVAGYFDNAVRVTNVADGSWAWARRGFAVAISPDGQYVVSGGRDDGMVRVWRMSDGDLVRTLSGHKGTVSSVAVSSDGQYIVSAGGDDGTICVWGMLDGALVRRFGGQSQIWRIAISSDGSYIASGCGDSTVKVWRLSEVPPSVSPPLAPTGPPRLEVRARFDEPSGNRALDAHEEATLMLTVENVGRSAAAQVRPIAIGTAAGLTIRLPESLPTLEVNERATFRVALAADGTIRDQEMRLRVVVEEARGFNSDTLLVEFEACAERPPELKIARLGLDDDARGESFGNGDGRFHPGESVELVAFIQNTGMGEAEAVSAQIAFDTGAQHIYLSRPQDASAKLGDIPAGAYAELPLVITVAPIYRGPQTLPLRLVLRDRRQRYHWELPLGLALEARTPAIQTVRIPAAEERPVVLRPLPPAGATDRGTLPDTTFRVAVLPLLCPACPDTGTAQALTDHLRATLHETGVFEVMERERMINILAEAKMGQDDIFTESHRVRMGELLNAQLLIWGRVGQAGDLYIVSLQATELETGRQIPVSKTCRGCAIDQVVQQAFPQAAAALAAEVLAAVSTR